MRIAVLGTGPVGRVLAARLAHDGHDVVIGTRNVHHTLASTELAASNAPPFGEWHRDHAGVRLLAFREVGESAELVVNANCRRASAPGARESVF